MRKAAAIFFSSVILMQFSGQKVFADAAELNIQDQTTSKPNPVPPDKPQKPVSKPPTPAQPPSLPENAPTPPQPPGDQAAADKKQVPAPVSAVPFRAFTGKITKNKVRMRIQPGLDAPILSELNRDDLLIVVGESDDFYAVKPPKDIKAYIFRTFVLDNVVEGTRVNVRLEPELDAPVIAQLNSGDKVQGSVSPLNSKWLEIAMPDSTRFYVCKDFVEKVGDPNMIAVMEKRRDDVNQLLNSAYSVSQNEMQKPYNQINLDSVNDSLNKIITNYPEFHDQVAKAKEIMTSLQENYLKKKIAYLETQSKSSAELQAKNSKLSAEIQASQERLSQLEQKIQQGKVTHNTYDNNDAAKPSQANDYDDNRNLSQTKGDNGFSINSKMAAWLPAENAIYDSWAEENNNLSMDTFYEEQNKNAVSLSGIIEPYNRSVKNKPGDYVLVNKSSHLPIAYLYSTKVNLQDRIGQEVSLQAATRPNNNFAFPAYFVISVE